MHDALGGAEQFRMAETFAGLAGNETDDQEGQLVEGAYALCSLFDQQLLKTYCWPAMPATGDRRVERQCFLLSRSYRHGGSGELRED